MSLSTILAIFFSGFCGYQLWNGTTSPTARLITVGLLVSIIIGAIL